MKKPTANRRKKSLFGKNRRLLWAGAALLAAGIVFAALEFGGVTNIFVKEEAPTTAENLPSETDNSNPYKPATDEEKKEVENSKANSRPPGNSPSTIPSTVVIESAQQQNEFKSVVVKTQLTGNGWASCKLTMTKGSNKVVKTAETLYQSAYSICLGFSVPLDELSESGQWQVKLTATKLDGSSVNAESKTVTVTK